MSAEDDEERSLVHMVTAPYHSRPDEEMTLIGLLYGLGLVLIIIPLLPFMVILWALSAIRGSAVAEPEH